MDGVAEGLMIGKDAPSPGDDPRAEARALLAELTVLRADLFRRSDARMADWATRVRRLEFLPSVANMADWLALREADLTTLQPRLSRLGLSTLGRLDGHVRPSLEAVIAALSAIAGLDGPVFPDPQGFDPELRSLRARRDALFGARDTGPGTRILVTLPSEAASDPAIVRELVAAGADAFRINCAHDSPEAWASMIGHIRKSERLTGRKLPISMDLGGPKFRVTKTGGPLPKRLQAGDRFAFVEKPSMAPEGRGWAMLGHPALLAALAPGVQVSVDDGKLWATVLQTGRGHALLEVDRVGERGLKLKPGRGVNLPGSHLDVAALTEEDLAALDVVVAEADLVAFSFVQTPGDVRALIAAMEARARHPRPLPAILLKIETPMGLHLLPELIVEAGGTLPVGVMIARGDLAVEIGFDRLSEIQEEILWLCEAAQVPVVWATQVLEGMVKEGQASRAEVTDAAMSQRADCVMLNKGPHVAAAIEFLRDILIRMDRHQTKKSARLGPLRVWAG
ncbi:pyruvate kinase [Cereibacter johrii]|uniref:Pyruvate kinase n=1 Tax=Cereibacter johrii TaxID=445629 RepID=A0ABX5JBQ5_9RHOB|nr:pyruvate kinase [Cereibacter johrii]ODM41539.1 pyruvate kinase [Cereibacter johrii]PTM81270.1 pyruvate kinase [Cereibacter johrii]